MYTKKNESLCEKPNNLARSLRFWIEEEGLYKTSVAKTKALIK